MDPKNPQKILGVATCACDLKYWEEEAGGWGWALWPESLVKCSVPSGTRWSAMEENTGYLWPHMYIYRHVGICTHMHTTERIAEYFLNLDKDRPMYRELKVLQ